MSKIHVPRPFTKPGSSKKKNKQSYAQSSICIESAERVVSSFSSDFAAEASSASVLQLSGGGGGGGQREESHINSNSNPRPHSNFAAHAAAHASSRRLTALGNDRMVLQKSDLIKILKKVDELEVEIAKAGGQWSKVVPGGNPFGKLTVMRIFYSLFGPFSKGTGRVMLHIMHKNPSVFYESMIHFSHIFAVYYTLMGVLGIEQATSQTGNELVTQILRFLWMLNGCLCMTGLVSCLHVLMYMQRMTPFELQANMFQQPVRMSTAYSLGPIGFFIFFECLICETVKHFLLHTNREAMDIFFLVLTLVVGISIPILYGFFTAFIKLADAARPYEYAAKLYVQSRTAKNHRRPSIISNNAAGDHTTMNSFLSEALQSLQQGSGGVSSSSVGKMEIAKISSALMAKGVTWESLSAAGESGQGQLLNSLLTRPEFGLEVGDAFQITTALIKYSQAGAHPGQNGTARHAY